MSNKPLPRFEWVSVKDRLPMGDGYVLATNGADTWLEEVPLWKRATHWMALPDPPDKTPAEKAFDECGLSPHHASQRDYFLAGYNAATKENK